MKNYFITYNKPTKLPAAGDTILNPALSIVRLAWGDIRLVDLCIPNTLSAICAGLPPVADNTTLPISVSGELADRALCAGNT